MLIGEFILRTLHKNKIQSIFGVPSGTCSPTVDALNDFNDIEFIISKNEAAATYAACKAAKLSNELQCCIMSGAVGVANGVNGIAEAYQSKAPMLILSGYVNTAVQGKGAMQELEAHLYLEGITKYNKVVTDPAKVKESLLEAMSVAMTAPMGPVHIGLPINVQKTEIDEIIGTYELPVLQEPESLELVLSAMEKYDQGIILVGGGARGVGELIMDLSIKSGWYVATTASGKGIISEDFVNCIGNYGFPGTDFANQIMSDEETKAVLALGTQLGENATNNYSVDLFSKIVMHIDSDCEALKKHEQLKSYQPILGDLRLSLEKVLKDITIKESRVQKYDATKELNQPAEEKMIGFSLRTLYEDINKFVPEDTIFMNDIGSTWMYAHKFLRVPQKGDYMCNANHACMGSTMGFIGVNRLNPERPIVVFTGDGSFYMNILAELLTARQHKMKVAFIVNNNSTLGYVSKGHEYIFGRTLEQFTNDFVDIYQIAKAMGIPAIQVRTNEELEKQIGILSWDGPVLIDVITDNTEKLPSSRFKVLKD